MTEEAETGKSGWKSVPSDAGLGSGLPKEAPPRLAPRLSLQAAVGAKSSERLPNAAVAVGCGAAFPWKQLEEPILPKEFWKSNVRQGFSLRR